MKKFLCKINQIVPVYMIIPLAFAVVANSFAYNGGRLIASNLFHFDMTGVLENIIPVAPWTIIIYIGAFLYWGINYIIGVRQDRQEAYRFISADFFAKCICLIVFISFPTTNVRPDIDGTSFWDTALRVLYSIDAADNLFPSIHCMASWFCFIAVRKNKSVQNWYKLLSFLITIAICVSTLTLKQHVFVDVIAGIGLAEFSYWFVRDTGFDKIYRHYIGIVQRWAFRKVLPRMEQ